MVAQYDVLKINPKAGAKISELKVTRLDPERYKRIKSMMAKRDFEMLRKAISVDRNLVCVGRTLMERSKTIRLNAVEFLNKETNEGLLIDGMRAQKIIPEVLFTISEKCAANEYDDDFLRSLLDINLTFRLPPRRIEDAVIGCAIGTDRVLTAYSYDIIVATAKKDLSDLSNFFLYRASPLLKYPDRYGEIVDIMIASCRQNKVDGELVVKVLANALFSEHYRKNEEKESKKILSFLQEAAKKNYETIKKALGDFLGSILLKDETECRTKNDEESSMQKQKLTLGLYLRT